MTRTSSHRDRRHLTQVFVYLLAITSLLSGCMGAKAISSVHDLPLPPEAGSMRDYDLAHNTLYEASAKKLILTSISAFNIPERMSKQMSTEFLVLPDGGPHEGEFWEFYEKELTPLGWQRNDDRDEVLMGVIDRFSRRSFRGTQMFVVTYVSIPDTRDLMMVRFLYPVW
jgi:hypothetical protein